MRSYFDLLQIQPEEWEIAAIRKFDAEAMSSYAEEMKQEQVDSKSKK